MKMSPVFLGIVAATAISACATSKQTFTADGREGYSLNCSGAARTWGQCLEKAGEICGTRGYEVLDRSDQQGSTVGGNQFGVYGGSLMFRSMLVACKK